MQNYRPDIDGLRAIAVLSVIAYHLSPLHFPAGGIGVDIFFVISGYLIGGILLRETQNAEFSFITFYTRRFRRIWPAFAVVMAATTIAGLVFSFPDDLIEQSSAAIAALLSVSNLYFAATVNYFNQGQLVVPLLHTWSLAVEEQFYIFIPVLILLLSRWAPRRVGNVLTASTILSFILSQNLVQTAPAHAFYLLDSRAWELLIGVLLNVYPLRWCESTKAREIATATGALALIISLVFIRPEQGFPGYRALLPCLGAALIIGGGAWGTNFVGQILSLKPFVFIGLISYSLYLWHWPVIIFTRQYLNVVNSSRGVVPLSIVVSFALAVLTWRFVERPFRQNKGKGDSPPSFRVIPIFRVVLIGTTVLVSCEMTILFAGGFPGRIPPAAAQYLADIGERDRGLDCPVEKGADSLFRICTAARNNSRNVLLIGDSHAMMFRSALAGASGANIMQVTATGCVLDRAAEPVPSTPCAYRIRQTLNGSIDWPRVSVIILSSRWQNLNEEQLGVLITTLKAHAPVIVIGPTPDYDQRVPQLLARAVIDRDYRVPSTRMLPRMRELDERVRAASTRSGAAYLSPMRAMCRATICAVSIRGRSLYLDSDHLTAQSAALLLRKLITTQLPRSGLAGEVLHALRGH